MARFNHRGKLVLVTGASSGIGRETAVAFAQRGAKVALIGRNVEALKSVQDYIRGNGGLAEMFPFDLINITEIPKLIASVEDIFGDSISLLVNNAGVAILGLVDSVPLEEYMYNLNINFFAPLALIKAVLPGMVKRRCGQIINITSGVGKRGLPGVSSYCVSKFALNALTESVRVELAPYGIDVISVSPGLSETGFVKNIKTYGELKDTFNEGRKTPPVKIARRIVIASERRERDVVLSFRAKIGYHLNYWAPGLFDYILIRKLRKEIK